MSACPHGVTCLLLISSPRVRWALWFLEQVAKNKQTLAVLDLCTRLVDFGAYSSVGELKALLTTLIQLLNGTNDLCSIDDETVWHALFAGVCATARCV